MGRGGGGGGRGGGGGNRSLEQQLAGNNSLEARAQAIRQASPSQLEAATQSNTISVNEASLELARRTETVSVNDLRAGDIVQDRLRVVEITSTSSTTGVRGRALSTTGQPTGPETRILSSTNAQRYQTPETGRAYQRIFSQFLSESDGIGGLLAGL